MPKICYVKKRFHAASVALINQCNSIIADYGAQGYDLTLRQLYYQLVSRNVISNSEREYKNLGDLVSDARLAGLIDWLSIIDRTRYLRANSHWDTPSDIIESAAASYQVDKWEDQRYHPEVWIEKDALVGVIAGVCSELDVPFFSCRGYTSSSEMWLAGQRLLRKKKAGQAPIIFHLGDHDPSGIDMSRDIQERLELFTGGPVDLQRLALNRDQIDRYNPPPNPAKVTDSRYESYRREHGDQSWELDALEPRVLTDLVRDAINGVVDDDAWSAAVLRENKDKRKLKKVADQWDDLTEEL